MLSITNYQYAQNHEKKFWLNKKIGAVAMDRLSFFALNCDLLRINRHKIQTVLDLH